jgi:hypothetical protein
MREFVESHGAKFLVGLQYNKSRDAIFEGLLQNRGIRYVSLDGVDHYPGYGQHWTPEGHAEVAQRLRALFDKTGVLDTVKAEQRPSVLSEEP